MQKFSTLLLVLLLAASLAISGCDDTSPDNSSETTAADTTTAIPEETGPVQANGNLTLAADGESIFTIIRGENASANEIEAAKTFYQTLKTEMSISLPLSTDFVKKAEDIDPNALEILIGSTNRPESETLAEGLAEQTFAIRTTNSKIVIAASDDLTLCHAVEYFFGNYTLELENATGTLRLAETIDFVSEPWNYYVEMLSSADTLTATSESLFTVASVGERQHSPRRLCGERLSLPGLHCQRYCIQ